MKHARAVSLAAVVVVALAAGCGGGDPASDTRTTERSGSAAPAASSASANGGFIEGVEGQAQDEKVFRGAVIAHLTANGFEVADSDHEIFRYQKGDVIHSQLKDLCAISVPDGIGLAIAGEISQTQRGIRDPFQTVEIVPIKILDEDKAYQDCLRILDRVMSDFSPPPPPGGIPGQETAP